MDSTPGQNLSGWMKHLGEQVVGAFVPPENREGAIQSGKKDWDGRAVTYVPNWSIQGRDSILTVELAGLGRDEKKIAQEAFKSAVLEITRGTENMEIYLGADSKGNITLNLRHIIGVSGDLNGMQSLFDSAHGYIQKWEKYLERTEGGERLPKRHGLDTDKPHLEKDTGFKQEWTDQLNEQMQQFAQDDFADTDERMPIINGAARVPIVLGALGSDLDRANFTIIDADGEVVSGMADYPKENKSSTNLAEIRASELYVQFKRAAITNSDAGITRKEVDDALMDFSKMMHQGIFGDLASKMFESSGVNPVPDRKLNPARPHYTMHMQENGEVIFTAHVKRPIESVTVIQGPNAGQYWCDPRSSFEEMTAQIKFTPAYLRRDIDSQCHFEVLNASYARKLVALEG